MDGEEARDCDGTETKMAGPRADVMFLRRYRCCNLEFFTVLIHFL